MNFTTSDVAATLRRIASDVESRKDELTALDAAGGDGDMGISAANGFRAVRESLDQPAPDIGRLLIRAGEAIEDNAGATIGALLGAAFMRAGRALAGKTEISLADLSIALAAAEEAITSRGKASVGDRTLLDALMPARRALDEAIAEGSPASAIAKRVMDAAAAGVAATASMQPKFGRARWIGERAVGHPDAGAMLVRRMIEAALAR